jgi:hypothetical protein
VSESSLRRFPESAAALSVKESGSQGGVTCRLCWTFGVSLMFYFEIGVKERSRFEEA